MSSAYGFVLFLAPGSSFQTLFETGLLFDCKFLTLMQYMFSMRMVLILLFLNTLLNMARINQGKVTLGMKTGVTKG